MTRPLAACALLSVLLPGVFQSPRGVAVPDAVNKPTLTYFPAAKACILFGGYPRKGAPLSETWSLRGGSWTKLDIAGPSARGGHAVAYDASRGRLVLFGGNDADGAPLGDTWEFDGTTWQQKSSTGPSARGRHRMAFDAATNRVLMFGGTSGPRSPHTADTWAWDGSAWTLVASEGPARHESAMTYDAGRRGLLLFGGKRAAPGVLGDTWTFAQNGWRQVDAAAPPGRDHHGMAFHEARGVAVLYGGWSGERMLGDTWLWNGAAWVEQHGPTGPSPRGGVPAMTYDSDRRKIVMYGGWGDAGPLQDVWEWDGEWTQVSFASDPLALAEELIAVDRAFSASAAKANLVDTLLGLFRNDVSMNWPKGFAMGRDEAKAALLSNAANADTRLSWTPLRAGVSADGLHGFTLGVMTMTMPDKTVRPAKYMAYWIKDASGWRVGAYKRAPAGAGLAPTEVWSPSLPARLVAPVTDPAVIDAHRASLMAAEKAFSDDAQVMGVGPAFTKWGRDDATHFGDPNSPGYTVGAAAIGGNLTGQAPPGPTTIEWSADRVLVASSGDLGITFGHIRAKDGSRPPFPFFTIWRRDTPTSPWRYIAE